MRKDIKKNWVSTTMILPLFKDIDYSNTSEVEEKVSQLFYNLKIKGLAVATCRNY